MRGDHYGREPEAWKGKWRKPRVKLRRMLNFSGRNRREREVKPNVDLPTDPHPQIVGKDGAPMVLIPASEFEMGTDPADVYGLVRWARGFYSKVEANWFGDEIPLHTVYLDAFHMDVYEVTNDRYARFMNECEKNLDADGHKLLHFDSEFCFIERAGDTYSSKSGYEDHPVVMVTWYGALAYAQFYGKRLPTEAEWEKAARGGLVGKRYPGGDDITHDHANYAGTEGRDVWEMTSPVGSFPPNGYGLYDMAGNVLEWCADWHDDEYYSMSPHKNPTGPGSGRSRVLRGGSCRELPYSLRVAYRSFNDPTLPYYVGGFRCAKDVRPC